MTIAHVQGILSSDYGGVNSTTIPLTCSAVGRFYDHLSQSSG